MNDILNWLLQGAFVAVAATVAMRAIDPHRARTRYGVLWLALLLIVVLPGVPAGLAAALPEAESVTPASARVPMVALPAGWWTSAAVPPGLWILWSCASTVHLASATIALRRVRRACRPFPADLEATLMTWMNVRTGGRRARLMLSSDVKSAAVLGYLSPVIAVAPEVLDLLDADDLDRIVVHEWAHVQRRDDLAHVVQLAVRVAVGWHPAVWWIDRQLRLEREVACDELAVSATGSATEYAACLVRLASLPVQALESFPALAAASNLRRRIVRILTPGGSSIRSRRSVAVVAGGVVCATALIVSGFRFVDVEAGRRAVDLAVRTALETAPRLPADLAARTNRSARAALRPIAAPRSRPEAATPGSNHQTAAAEPPSPPRVDETPVPVPTATEPLAATTVPSPQLLAVVGSHSSSLASRDVSDAVTVANPWSAAVDAGANVGQTSEKAALATAAFFTRFGKRVARSF